MEKTVSVKAIREAVIEDKGNFYKVELAGLVFHGRKETKSWSGVVQTAHNGAYDRHELPLGELDEEHFEAVLNELVGWGTSNTPVPDLEHAYVAAGTSKGKTKYRVSLDEPFDDCGEAPFYFFADDTDKVWKFWDGEEVKPLSDTEFASYAPALNARVGWVKEPAPADPFDAEIDARAAMTEDDELDALEAELKGEEVGEVSHAEEDLANQELLEMESFCPTEAEGDEIGRWYTDDTYDRQIVEHTTYYVFMDSGSYYIADKTEKVWRPLEPVTVGRKGNCEIYEHVPGEPVSIEEQCEFNELVGWNNTPGGEVEPLKEHEVAGNGIDTTIADEPSVTMHADDYLVEVVTGGQCFTADLGTREWVRKEEVGRNVVKIQGRWEGLSVYEDVPVQDLELRNKLNALAGWPIEEAEPIGDEPAPWGDVEPLKEHEVAGNGIDTTIPDEYWTEDGHTHVFAYPERIYVVHLGVGLVADKTDKRWVICDGEGEEPYADINTQKRLNRIFGWPAPEEQLPFYEMGKIKKAEFGDHYGLKLTIDCKFPRFQEAPLVMVVKRSIKGEWQEPELLNDRGFPVALYEALGRDYDAEDILELRAAAIKAWAEYVTKEMVEMKIAA